MNDMLIRQFLKQPIAFHRVLADITGSALDALFLSQCIYWNDVVEKAHPERDGWFYKSAEEWHEETAMSRRELETARRSLKEKGILEEKKEGVPCRLHYRVNWATLQTRLPETAKLERSKTPFLFAQNGQAPIKTETTAQTTKESRSDSLKSRGTEPEIIEFCISIGLPASDGEAMFHKWEGVGWRNGGTTIKDWKAVIRSWKASGYMPSQKQGGNSNYGGTTAPKQRASGDLNQGRYG